MFKKVCTVLGFSILSFGCSIASSSAADGKLTDNKLQDPFTVISGYGTTGAFIGQSRSELVKSLGNPLNSMKESGACYEESLQWIDVEKSGALGDGNGLIAYLKDDRVLELSYSAKKYVTSDGIGYGSVLSGTNSEMRTLPILSLTRSSSEATNGKLQRYVVDRDTGLAFLIEGVDRVAAIYVFERNTQFQPNGCLGHDQRFIEAPK